MPEIPRDRAPDSSLGLLRDGYEFVGRRARRHQADVFEARLLLQTTICMLGRDAAVVFYDEGRFQRFSRRRWSARAACRGWTIPRTVTVSSSSWDS